jgi:hypothetical protein
VSVWHVEITMTQLHVMMVEAPTAGEASMKATEMLNAGGETRDPERQYTEVKVERGVR